MSFYFILYILFRLTPYTGSDDMKGRRNVSEIIMNKAQGRGSVRCRLPIEILAQGRIAGVFLNS